MKKSIIIASCMLIAVSCNVFDKDDDNDPPTPPPVEGVTDIAITDIITPEFIAVGANAEVEAVVENVGSEDVSESFLVILTNETTETNLDTVEVDGLSSGEELAVSLEWVTTTEGEVELSAYHTFDDEDGDNDEATETVEISEASASDLALVELTAAESATIGDTVNIEIAVQNAGTEDITEAFDITLEDQTNATTLYTESFEGLSSGTDTVVTFDWVLEDATAGEYTIVASHNFADDNADNDQQTATITVNEDDSSEEPATDVAITAITAPDSVDAGTSADIEVTVTNSGEEITDDITLTLTDNTDGTTIGTEVVNGLAADAESTVTISWNTTDATAGDHELSVTHDYADDNTANDTETTTVFIDDGSDDGGNGEDEGEEPNTNVDLVISNIVAPDNVSQGDTAFIQVTIDNLGPEALTDDVPVVLYHHNIEEGRTTLSEDLAADGSTTVTIEWLTADQTTGEPPHPLDITIEYADADETNNTAQTAIQVDPEEEA